MHYLSYRYKLSSNSNKENSNVNNQSYNNQIPNSSKELTNTNQIKENSNQIQINQNSPKKDLTLNKTDSVNKELDIEELFSKTPGDKVEMVKLDINQMFDLNIQNKSVMPEGEISNQQSKTSQSTKQTQNLQSRNVDMLFSNVNISKSNKVYNTNEPKDDDFDFSIESSKSNEDFEDLEEDEYSDGEDLDNFIKQELENEIISEMYTDTETKNDKVIFGNDIIKEANIGDLYSYSK